MLWKSLSGVTAVILAIGLYFSYKAQVSHSEERKLSERSTQYLDTIQKEIARAGELKTAKEQQFIELEKKREGLNSEFAKVSENISDKNRELEATKNNLDEVKKQITGLEEKIALAGNLEKLQADIRELNKEKEATDSSVSALSQSLALSDGRIKEAQDRVKKVLEDDARQRRGVVDSDFTARVSQSFLEHGFVVLNKGNSQGIFTNAILDVRRGRNVVARLKVRSVEQDSSVADLVPGSLAAGSSVRSGDMVVASSVQPNISVAPTEATPSGEAAPAAAPSPEALAAPVAPADGSDPFASPAAMPAPAEAPAGADPFGAPAAPAAPATPPADDPFGAAPAPAAPAPAAAPAGADPFAPAPAAPAAPAQPGTSAAPAEKDPFSMQ